MEEVVRADWCEAELFAALPDAMAPGDQELVQEWILRNRTWTLDPYIEAHIEASVKDSGHEGLSFAFHLRVLARACLFSIELAVSSCAIDVS